MQHWSTSGQLATERHVGLVDHLVPSVQRRPERRLQLGQARTGEVDLVRAEAEELVKERERDPSLVRMGHRLQLGRQLPLGLLPKPSAPCSVEERETRL